MLAFAVSTPALAQQRCGSRDAIVKMLDDKYDEMQMAAGSNGTHHIVELWTTTDGATWTLLFSRADGYTCILGDGLNWAETPLAVPGKDT